MGDQRFAPDSCWARALQEIDVGLMIADRETGQALFVNDYAQQLIDSVAADIDLSDAVLKANAPRSAVGRQQASRGTTSQLIRSAGKTLGITIHAADDVAVVLVKDITAKASFQEALGQQESAATVVTVFSQLRHEIGNPLNSMKMTLQVLQENIGTFSAAKTNSYITRTINEIARLETLLSSLKQLTAKEMLDTREVDLSSAIPAFVRNVEEQAQRRGAQIAVDLHEEARFVLAEPDTVQQILHNLFSNSLDAKSPDRDRVRIEISCSASEVPGMVRIRFQDNGQGIPRHCLQLIFRPMYTTKPQGTGLGLALVERLTKRMSGAVRVSSEPGEGTAVDILLPRGAPA